MTEFEALAEGGPYLARYNVFEDERGAFKRIFCTQEFSDILGQRSIVQMNYSSNKAAGTVRGIHYQTPPHAELKIIQCVKGRLLDVAVDLRAGSDNFLNHYAVELSADDQQAFILPEGFGHGFQVLEPDTEILYFHTSAYAPDSGVTLNPMDPSLKIDWPLPVSFISGKDKDAPFIEDDFKGVVL